mgnify:CR=1 FL=1|jgi:hypothetical protein
MRRVINVYNDLRSRAEIAGWIIPATEIGPSTKPSEEETEEETEKEEEEGQKQEAEDAESQKDQGLQADKAPVETVQKQAGRKAKRDA